MVKLVAIMIASCVVGCGYKRPADVVGDDVPSDAAAEAGGEAGIDAPPIGTACNALVQTECGAGNKCGWITDTATTGHAGCVPDGAQDIDAACTFGPVGATTGFSDCKAGTECNAGKCQAICDLKNQSPLCDGNHSCLQFANLFSDGTTFTAGVCDPRCDPLTQALRAGTPAAACGSTNPAAPNKGCYSADQFISGHCNNVPAGAATLFDRAIPVGGAQPFVNGCAPGYQPFFLQMTGSTQGVCTGTCAPLKTDASLVNNVRGNPNALAKLPNKAAPAVGDGICVTGKKGSQAASQNENCLFIWRFLVDQNGNPSTSEFNDTLGVCFAFQFYTYDRDGDGGQDPMPSCHTLPSRQALPAGCTCDASSGHCSGTGCPDGVADEFGCYPLSMSTITANGKLAPVKPRGVDFRLGYGPGVAVRPTLR